MGVPACIVLFEMTIEEHDETMSLRVPVPSENRSGGGCCTQRT